MIIKKTFRYRLKPSRKQKNLCTQFAGACRWIFNRGLARKKKIYDEKKENFSYYDLNNELPQLKKQEETNWLKDIHSQVLQQALKDLDSAFSHFYRRVKKKENPGFPKFKRKGERDSFRYPQGVKVQGNIAFLPKIGKVRFKKSRQIQGTIKQATIVKEADKWYICFSCEIDKEIPAVELDLQRAVGIDVGLTYYATLAIGEENKIEEISNPRFLEKSLPRLRYLHKNLSRKKFKSQNRNKAKRKLQKFLIKQKDRRKDFAHKLSTQIVKSHDIIGIESISVSSLMQSGLTHLARNIADAGWRQFLECLKYKAKEWGKACVEVGRWFASTATCSRCGSKNKLKLSDRILHCHCGFEIGRDANASINIKDDAIRQLKAAGTSVLKPVELPGYWSCEAGIFRL